MILHEKKLFTNFILESIKHVKKLCFPAWDDLRYEAKLQMKN